MRDLHLLCVGLTGTLFFVRGIWMLRESPLADQRWPRFVAPVIDSVLLLTGIIMMTRIGQYPGTDSWLTAKLSAVLLYVVFGTIGIKRGRTKKIRTVFWSMALMVFVYILSVARTHQPFPWS